MRMPFFMLYALYGGDVKAASYSKSSLPPLLLDDCGTDADERLADNLF